MDGSFVSYFVARFTTFLAWILLGEIFSAGNILGIILTLVEIAWVVLESNPKSKLSDDKTSIL